MVITCLKHGDFKQRPYSHKQGQGCPVCNNSKGERDVRLFLEKHNIVVESYTTLEECDVEECDINYKIKL